MRWWGEVLQGDRGQNDVYKMMERRAWKDLNWRVERNCTRRESRPVDVIHMKQSRSAGWIDH
jgi:hypothetical protein